MSYYNRYMRGMSNGGLVTGQALSNEELRNAVPSIFATEAHESRCRVAFKGALPQSVWRHYPETGKFRRDIREFEEALVARVRCFGPKR